MPLRVFCMSSGFASGSGGSPWDSRFLIRNSGILYAYPAFRMQLVWSLKTCGILPCCAARFLSTRMTLATSTSCGHLSVHL